MSKPQSAMATKLSELRSKITNNSTRKPKYDNYKPPEPPPVHWLEDGGDHINIWENGETDLGRLLAHNSDLPFNHNIFGKFCNIEAFWHYIQSVERDDRIRIMSGQILKNFSKKQTMERVTNFRAIIADSNYQRIKQYKAMVDAVKESVLPFDCYYVNPESGIRVRPIFFKWLIKAFEEIRLALKEDREPNFKFLIDQHNSGIYDFVIPAYVKEAQARKAQKKQEEKPNKIAALLEKQKDEVMTPDKTDEHEDTAIAVDSGINESTEIVHHPV